LQQHSQYQKALIMKKNRFAKRAAVAAGFIFLCVAPGLARADNGLPGAAQTPRTAQPKRDSAPPDDFTGLTYTDEQKAEIDKIHRESESQREAVVKDQKLTADQKGAMLLGYTRMESGRRYRVLTPEQQRQVRQRIVARREQDKAAQKRQPPRN
jgi:Spy/CpxP family protein refolding chaperone